MAKNWIAGAIKHPGAMTRKAKAAGKTPMTFAREEQGEPGTTGRQARLALTLYGFRKKPGAPRATSAGYRKRK